MHIQISYYLVAPQPVKSRQWVTITAGADLILPCNIEMAYPPPVFHWQHIMPHEDEIAENVQPLKNGSLLLTGVKAPAIYKCTAWNEYGTSIQFIYISKHKLLTIHYKASTYVCTYLAVIVQAILVVQVINETDIPGTCIISLKQYNNH